MNNFRPVKSDSGEQDESPLLHYFARMEEYLDLIDQQFEAIERLLGVPRSVHISVYGENRHRNGGQRRQEIAMPRRKEERIVQSSVISRALKVLRQSTGLRQIDVAQASGLSKAMVSAYEGGKALPSLLNLSRYLNAIGRDLGDLQNALDEMGGIPGPRIIEAEMRERKVGRAVLGLLQSMGMVVVDGTNGPEVVRSADS